MKKHPRTLRGLLTGAALPVVARAACAMLVPALGQSPEGERLAAIGSAIYTAHDIPALDYVLTSHDHLWDESVKRIVAARERKPPLAIAPHAQDEIER